MVVVGVTAQAKPASTREDLVAKSQMHPGPAQLVRTDPFGPYGLVRPAPEIQAHTVHCERHDQQQDRARRSVATALAHDHRDETVSRPPAFACGGTLARYFVTGLP